jgi:hypothetical protein
MTQNFKVKKQYPNIGISNIPVKGVLPENRAQKADNSRLNHSFPNLKEPMKLIMGLKN